MYYHVDNGKDLYNLLSSNILNVIKIYSNSCAPCKTYAPEYQNLSQKYNNINFLDLNMRSNLVKVNAVPTTLIIKDGIIVEKIMGSDIMEVESKLISFM